MRIEVWADVVCPWCYIGVRRLEAALAGDEGRDEVEVVHRSFELSPRAALGVVTPLPESLAAKYGVNLAEAHAMCARVTAVAADDGLIPYVLAENVTGSTAWAHRLLAYAGDEGRGPEAWERLFAAYFTEGRSVFTREALLELAGEIGLDAGEAAAAALESEAYRLRVQRDAEAAASLGATGVPFFLLDRRWTIAGAQSAEALRGAISQAREVSRG